MSSSRPPNSSGHLPHQITHSLKRQLPLSSMKPPFASPGDYHRFAPDSRLADQEPDAIVLKSPVSLFFLFLFYMHISFITCVSITHLVLLVIGYVDQLQCTVVHFSLYALEELPLLTNISGCQAGRYPQFFL